MSAASVIVLAPNSFARFLGAAVESQFALMIDGDHQGSLHNFDMLFNSPLASPPLDNGFKEVNPMAGYYLESFLKLHGYEARCVFDWNDDGALERALGSDPIAVALSTTYITDNELLATCLEALRGVVGDLPVVVGGPYIWKQKIELGRDGCLNAEEVAEARSWNVELLEDCLFFGAKPTALRQAIYVAHEFGEYTLLRVLDKIREGKTQPGDLVDVPNLVLPTGANTWHATAEAIEPVDLNRDYTRWDLVDSVPAIVPLRASVGCPYRCRFCDFIELHPRVTMRSPDSIASEIELAGRFSARFFDFIDDNIFLSRKRIGQLTRTLLDAELDIVWGGFFRVDRIDESNVDDLVRSGCRFGLCGIESVDEGQLRRLRKGCKRDEVIRGIELATGAGINLNLSLLIGFPGETRASLDNTIGALNGLPARNRGFASWLGYPFYLLPNTAADALDYRRQHNLKGRRGTWQHDTMTSDEVADEWAPYLFRNLSLPYHYYTGDVPNHWSVEKRCRGFGARRDLTRAFLDRSSDAEIQRAFAQLYANIKDGGSASEAPRWRGVLADRSLQPGERSSYSGAFGQ